MASSRGRNGEAFLWGLLAKGTKHILEWYTPTTWSPPMTSLLTTIDSGNEFQRNSYGDTNIQIIALEMGMWHLSSYFSSFLYS